MNKKFTKLIAALALLVFMTPSMVGWGQTKGSYTITFNGTNSESTNITTNMACSSLVSEGASYLSGNVVTATKAYGPTSNGVKLGTSSAAGVLKMNLSTDGQVTPTSIVVRAKRYNSGTSATLSVNGSTAQTLSNSTDYADYTFTITSAITYLQLNCSKYSWVKSITVNYGSSSNPAIVINPAVINEDYTSHYSSGYDDNALVMALTDITTNDPDDFSVLYSTTETGTYSATVPSWFSANVYNHSGTFKVGWTLNGQYPESAHECYFKVMYGETASNAVHVTQSAAPTPSITITGTGITNNAIALEYNDEEVYTATVTYNNMENPTSGVTVGLYSDDACTTSFSGDWFTADFETNSVTSIEYTAIANTTTSPRTVYMRVNYGTGSGQVPCDVIAITQAGVPTYTVTYDNNGGTGIMTDSNNPYLAGATVTVLGNTFTKEHYTFVNWNTQADGSGTEYVAEDTFIINANTTLYAQWTGNTHTVTLPTADTYGEYTMDKTNPVAYGTEVTLTYTPANGYEAYVATWSVNGNAISGNKFSMPDENVTVTVAVTEAHGTAENPYTVAEARAAIDAGTGTSNVYTRGIVSSSNGLSGSTITYFISDDGTSTNTLQVYKGKGLNNSNFTNGYDVQPGDVVVVYGTISYYSTASVYQYNNGNYLHYIKPVIAPNATSVGNLENFSYIGNGPSAAQNFKVRGRNLTENLLLTASEDYEICATSDGTYESSLSISTTNGSEKTIYVRMKANLGAGTHNGTVTMTSADAVTKTVELTGSVSYSITYPASYTNGNVTTAPNTAEVGATVTIVTAPDAYYYPSAIDFSSTPAPENVTISGNNISFTMPTGNVVISSITFAHYENVTVTYSVNGNTTTVAAATIEAGTSTTLPTNVEDLVVNEVTYTFEGWTADESEITSSSILTGSYTPTGDVTLYAVYSITEMSSTPAYVLVESDLGTNWAGDYLIAYSSTVFADGRTGGETGIGKNGQSANPGTNLNGKIINATWGDTYHITLEEISSGSNTYLLKTQDGYYNYRTANSNGISTTLNSTTADDYPITISYVSSSEINLEISFGTTHVAFRYNTGSSGYFRYYKDGGQSPVYLYKREMVPSNVTSYYTLIKDITEAETMANVYASHILTVKNNGVLTVTGNESNCLPENLIIEDGGQLISDDVIEATIKKNITAYDPSLIGQGVSNGWYFISSPLNGEVVPTDVKNMIATTAEDYDLYKLVGNTWANYKEDADGNNQDPLFNLYTGHGYLYANAASVTLEFAGSLNYRDPDNDFVSLDNTGWNLVGNPFAYNTYPSMSYYKMNEAGTGIDATEYTTANAVPPCTGILVYDDEDNPQGLITFSKTAPASGGAKGGINLTLAETQRGAAKLDNAIVSFNEGSQLGKFYFMQQNANLYIPQGTEEYAIVSSEGQGTMPVNFRANENGQYTLTVNPENVEMNYLHLIDNMTGADIDLLQTPSYSFNATTTDYESRFKLVFATNNEDGASTGSTAFAFYSNGNWIISNIGEATLQVVDVNGRILSSETVNGSVSKAINATPGVYMLRLINGENVKVQKIVVR